jgi:hypothetical protein
MTWDAQQITAAFQGAAVLLTGVASLAALRSSRAASGRRAGRERDRLLLAALGHITKLERYIARRGLPVPARPALLEGDDSDGSGNPSAATSHS